MMETKEESKEESTINVEEIQKTTESLKKEMEALTEEVKLTKEALIKSKGNLTESIEEKAPYVFIEKFREGTGYPENAMVMVGKNSGKVEMFAAHPEKWY